MPATITCTGVIVDRVALVRRALADAEERPEAPPSPPAAVRPCAALSRLVSSATSIIRSFACPCLRPRRTCTTASRSSRPAAASSSITNATGMRRTSPGASVCCVKQKHSSFLKWRAGELRPVARDRLPGHRRGPSCCGPRMSTCTSSPGMDAHALLHRREGPRQVAAQVRVELHRQRCASCRPACSPRRRT